MPPEKPPLTQRATVQNSYALHELVHVRQYRELGTDRFVEEFLAEVMGLGDAPNTLESEAQAFKQALRDRYNSNCAVVF